MPENVGRTHLTSARVNRASTVYSGAGDIAHFIGRTSEPLKLRRDTDEHSKVTKHSYLESGYSSHASFK